MKVPTAIAKCEEPLALTPYHCGLPPKHVGAHRAYHDNQAGEVTYIQWVNPRRIRNQG